MTAAFLSPCGGLFFHWRLKWLKLSSYHLGSKEDSFLTVISTAIINRN